MMTWREFIGRRLDRIDYAAMAIIVGMIAILVAADLIYEYGRTP